MPTPPLPSKSDESSLNKNRIAFEVESRSRTTLFRCAYMLDIIVVLWTYMRNIIVVDPRT